MMARCWRLGRTLRQTHTNSSFPRRPRGRPPFGAVHTIGKFRLSATSAARPIRAGSDDGIPKSIADIVTINPSRRTDKQKQDLAAHYRTIAPQLATTRAQLAELQKERETLFKT